MKSGRQPTYQDRIEVIELLKILRHKDARVSDAIRVLEINLKRDYWGKENLSRMRELIIEYAESLDSFTRLRK